MSSNKLDNIEHDDDETSQQDIASANAGNVHQEKPYKRQIVWKNVVLFSFLHLASLYGLYLAFTSAKLYTCLFAYFLYFVTGLSITAGVHRLWTHRAYKAKWPLRLFLAVCNTMAFQNSIYEWARDHRLHHKYSEMNADPHNAQRGFFFSHIGWLMVRKHPDVITNGRKLDTSDLTDDPIVTFQRKVYIPAVIVLCFVIPTVIPNWYWGETYLNAYLICGILRYCVSLNCTWLVNSAAHMWGNRPYDKYINPRENRIVCFLAQGEGYHNYHHTFPYDYTTSEYKYGINVTTQFINLMAFFGQAYDLKSASPETINKRKLRTGE